MPHVILKVLLSKSSFGVSRNVFYPLLTSSQRNDVSELLDAGRDKGKAELNVFSIGFDLTSDPREAEQVVKKEVPDNTCQKPAQIPRSVFVSACLKLLL